MEVKASELTVEQASQIILEEYEKEIWSQLDEIKATAILLTDPRRLKDGCLQVCYAAEWLYRNRFRVTINMEYSLIKRKLRYRRLLKRLTPKILVLMLDPYKRMEMLLRSPRIDWSEVND